MTNSIEQLDTCANHSLINNNIRQVFDIYNKMSRDNIESSLAVIYAQDIIFIDPIRESHGLNALNLYFNELFTNVEKVDFLMIDVINSANQASVFWELTLKNKRLNASKSFTIEGMSQLKFNPDGKVFYHHDYFDVGAMIYERLPFLGRIIRYVKSKVKGD